MRALGLILAATVGLQFSAASSNIDGDSLGSNGYGNGGNGYGNDSNGYGDGSNNGPFRRRNEFGNGIGNSNNSNNNNNGIGNGSGFNNSNGNNSGNSNGNRNPFGNNNSFGSGPTANNPFAMTPNDNPFANPSSLASPYPPGLSNPLNPLGPLGPNSAMDMNVFGTHKLRIATFNVWDLYIARDRKTRIDAIGRYFTKNPRDIDILALQELWISEDYRTLKGQMALEFPHSHYFASGAVGSGLAIFSRYPIKDAWWHGFTITGKPGRIFDGDWYAGKGVGAVRVHHPNLGPIDVFDTHLIANYSPSDPSNDRYRSHRATQLYEVLRHVDRTSSPTAYTFLLGDMNSAPKQDLYQSLITAHNLYTPYRRPLRNVWRDIHRHRNGETPDVGQSPHPEQWDSQTAKVAKEAHLHYTFNLPTSTYYKSSEPSQQIDHIFYIPDGRLRCEHAEVFLNHPTKDANGNNGPSYSDHAALVATFEITPSNQVILNDQFTAAHPRAKRHMAQATQQVMVSLNEELSKIQSQQGTDKLIALLLALLTLGCMGGGVFLMRKACSPEAVSARSQLKNEPSDSQSLHKKVPPYVTSALLFVIGMFLAMAMQWFVFNVNVFLPQEYAAFREFQYEWALWLKKQG